MRKLKVVQKTIVKRLQWKENKLEHRLWDNGSHSRLSIRSLSWRNHPWVTQLIERWYVKKSASDYRMAAEF